LYVSLNSNISKSGFSKSSTTHVLRSGNWLVLKHFISTDKKLSFKQTSVFDWVETENDRVVFNFEFVEENGENIILLDPTRSIHVSLDSNSARWGTSKNNIPNLLFTGTWASTATTTPPSLINWNGNDWAMACDFLNSDLSNVLTTGSQW